MKKLFIVLALAGMVGSVSATTFSSLTGNVIVSVKNDDKKKKSRKEKKEKEACCTKDGEKKGGCCKDKKAEEAKPANPQ
ncbi:MAG: hypothetical protein M3R17_16230 [Bacteroidota bacterium]|nr:hypothetical protein [Bacteroidota bacterium]